MKGTMESQNPQGSLNFENVKRAEAYLRQNQGSYSPEALKASLISNGYSEAEVGAALKNIQNNPNGGVAGPSMFEVGDLFSAAWQLLRRVWKRVFVVLAISQIPMALLTLQLSGTNFSIELGDIPSTSSLGLIAIIVIISMIVSFVTMAAATVLVINEDQGQNMSLGQSFKTSLPVVLPYFLVSLLAGLATLLGAIFLIIPGIIVGVWFSLVPYVFFAEGLRGTQALARSRQLVSGSWWAIFGRLILVGIVVIAVTMPFSILSNIPFLGVLASIFSSVLTSSITLIFGYCMYKAVRAIKG